MTMLEDEGQVAAVTNARYKSSRWYVAYYSKHFLKFNIK